jgi:hypothetical protein
VTSARSTEAFGASLALAGLAATLTDAGPARVRFFLVAAGLFFSVGCAAIAAGLMAGGAERRKEPLALAFPLSAAVLFLPILIGEITGLGTRPFAWLVRLLLLSAAIVLVRSIRKGSGRVAAPHPLLLAVAIGAGIFACARGSLVTLPSDALDHLAVLREIQATGEVSPTTSYYAESTDLRLDARRGFVFPAAAAAGSLAGADARAVYDALPGIVAFFFVLSFYALARETLGGGAASALALLYAVLSFEGGILGTWFGRASSPALFAAPALWCAILLVYVSSRGDGIRPLPLALTGFALMGIHLFAAVTALLLGGLFLLGLLFLRGGRGDAKNALFSLCYLGLGFLPIGIWRVVKTYPPVDPIHTHLQGVLWVTDRLYAANPFLAFDRLGLFALLAFPLSLLLIGRARSSRADLFLVATTLFPLLLVLNPLLVPLLVPVVGYLLARILWFGGNYLVLGRLVADWGGAMRRKKRLVARAGAALAIVVLNGFFAMSLWARDATEIGSRLTATPKNLKDSPRPEGWADLFSYMEKNLPPRAVVAADPISGYMIPACTPQKTVAVMEQHGSTGDPLAPDRVLDMVRAASPFVSERDTAGILRRWNADYVLVNFRVSAPVTSFYASIDPSLYEAALEKFRSAPARYRELYGSDRCHLFAFESEGEAGPADSLPVLKAAVDSLPLFARRVDHAFPNGIRLEAAAVAPDTIRAGERVLVTCYWTKVSDPPDRLPYKVYYRLVRPAGAQPESKWGRKAEEIRTGRTHRARTMRNLLKGALPPEDWPAGARLADTADWTVPASLEEGSYDLEVALRRSPLVGDFHLKDFLSEEDSFSGVAVARITVLGRAAPPRPS